MCPPCSNVTENTRPKVCLTGLAACWIVAGSLGFPSGELLRFCAFLRFWNLRADRSTEDGEDGDDLAWRNCPALVIRSVHNSVRRKLWSGIADQYRHGEISRPNCDGSYIHHSVPCSSNSISRSSRDFHREGTVFVGLFITDHQHSTVLRYCALGRGDYITSMLPPRHGEIRPAPV
jgi:hypothetical protein